MKDTDSMTTKEPVPISVEILGLVRHAHEVHDALARLFRSCAPHCTPEDNTLFLMNQLDNAIAGYRQSLEAIRKTALVYVEQVGEGPLVANVRDGFRRLANMAPGWSEDPGADFPPGWTA